jgi:[acyl-carrier-protein] S-malonyltransferase
LALSYILGTDGASVEPAGARFYEQYEVMRDWCKRVEQWTGFEMPELLTEDYTPSLRPGEPADLTVRPDFLHRAEVRQAAYALGIADILAEQGIYPDLIAGTSLGGLVAACLAGSFGREELFRLIGQLARFPLAPAGEPARGVAFGMLPGDADPGWYWGAGRPHVYPVLQQRIGSRRWVMLSGYLKNLEQLAAEAPRGHIQPPIGAVGGSHTPLQKFVQDLIEPVLGKIGFQAPRVALISAAGGPRLGTPLRTGEDVRMDLLDSFVQPSSTAADLAAVLENHDTQLALAVGSALRFGRPRASFPVLQAAVTEDLPQIVTTIWELGIGRQGDA